MIRVSEIWEICNLWFLGFLIDETETKVAARV